MNTDNAQPKPLESQEIINTLLHLAPMIQQLFPFDCMLAVTDRNTILKNVQTSTFTADSEGLNVKKGSSIEKAMQTGKVTKAQVPKEVYGVPFNAISVPVTDESGLVIGCMSIAISLEQQELLNEALQSFFSNSEEIVSTTEALTASAQELSGEMTLLNEMQQEMIRQVEDTDAILGMIEKIASSSNMLGLNASIEAARAGSQGKGFAVVAGEIRKMADQSTSAISEIKRITDQLKQKVATISQSTQRVSEIALAQAASSEEISVALQQLSSSVSDMEKAAKIM
ncbi:methyl-accepting chemotaxis protein [Anoxynatronum sibiricum]|uniref:Methyl-accepting chemotaxis protein n=1 Tax=Anoxynatronum sibiricum TaxID=210623 RepID=A0ABU9VXR7_9CLOT